MVKWYNASLPRTSWEFDSPWPHRETLCPLDTGYVLQNKAFLGKAVDKCVGMFIKDILRFVL